MRLVQLQRSARPTDYSTFLCIIGLNNHSTVGYLRVRAGAVRARRSVVSQMWRVSCVRPVPV